MINKDEFQSDEAFNDKNITDMKKKIPEIIAEIEKEK